MELGQTVDKKTTGLMRREELHCNDYDQQKILKVWTTLMGNSLQLHNNYEEVQKVDGLTVGPRPQWTGICEVNTESNDR